MRTRLDLLCAAATAGLRAGVFTSPDAPLDPKARAALTRLSGQFQSYDVIFASPARAALETAEALGLAAAPETALRDCDFGGWAGRALSEIESVSPEALALWLSDPQAAPHGGESLADAAMRVGQWMDGLAGKYGRVLAITHAAALRGAIIHALGAPAFSLSHVDVSPLCLARFSGVRRDWRFSGLIPAKSGPRGNVMNS